VRRRSTSARNGPFAPDRVDEPTSSWSKAAKTVNDSPAELSSRKAVSDAWTEERLSRRHEAKNSPCAPNTALGSVG